MARALNAPFCVCTSSHSLSIFAFVCFWLNCPPPLFPITRLFMIDHVVTAMRGTCLFLRQASTAAVLAGARLLPELNITESGTPGSASWRLRFSRAGDGAPQSAWHDIPIRPLPFAAERAEADEKGSGAATVAVTPALDEVVFVNEISRGSRAKMEMMKEEEHNPIGQDRHKKKPGAPLRFFTYGDMPFNYGFIPRTWEDPDRTDDSTACKGDGDPIDVVHLGPPLLCGAVCVVRVLGVLALIDQGETDWKLITESAPTPYGYGRSPRPPKEGEYGSLSKVPQEVQKGIVDWFRNYKTTDGAAPNEFAFGGVIRGAEDAIAVLEGCAMDYEALLNGASSSSSKHGYYLPNKTMP